MTQEVTSQCTAFDGTRRIASGTIADVARAARAALDRGASAPILVFDDETSELVELDLRGTDEEVVARLAGGERTAARAAAPDDALAVAGAQSPRGPGRPRLGVVAREVTLLPRHWEWLNRQPGGASVALRKLVDEARRVGADADRVRRAQEVAYRFMSVMAGDQPGFEEASRALFAANPGRFTELIADWPVDVRDHVHRLATGAFGVEVAGEGVAAAGAAAR